MKNFADTLKQQKDDNGVDLFTHLCNVIGGMKYNPIKCIKKPYESFE